MKVTSFAVVSLLGLLAPLGGCGGAQPAAPAPAAPPPGAAVDEAARTDGDITEARVHGLRVLIKRVPGAELVAGHLFVRGGVRNWGKNDAGVETLLVRTSAAGGTEGLERDAFTRRLADLGSNIGADAHEDYSVYAAKALKPNWDATFELLADVFLRPALPAAELELQRSFVESRLKHEQEDPDARLEFLARQSLFKGHPYENRPVGDATTIASLGRDALLAHLAKLRETSRLLLVVVGDVDPAHILEAVHKAFGQVTVGSYVESPLPPLVVGAARVSVTEQKLPTNYIQATFAAPGLGDPEHAAALVALRALAEREFEEVRTKRNLSYAPSARYIYRTGVPIGFLYVTAVDPKTTMKVMLDEARRLRDEPIGAVELAGDKSILLTHFYLDNEASDGQAELLGDAQIIGGDWHLVRTLSDRVKAVTAADVQAFARKHLTRLQTQVLGDPKSVDEAALKSL